MTGFELAGTLDKAGFELADPLTASTQPLFVVKMLWFLLYFWFFSCEVRLGRGPARRWLRGKLQRAVDPRRG